MSAAGGQQSRRETENRRRSLAARLIAASVEKNEANDKGYFPFTDSRLIPAVGFQQHNWVDVAEIYRQRNTFHMTCFTTN